MSVESQRPWCIACSRCLGVMQRDGKAAHDENAACFSTKLDADEAAVRFGWKLEKAHCQECGNEGAADHICPDCRRMKGKAA